MVRVTTAAICGSDLHIHHGSIPGICPGDVLGHEVERALELETDSLDTVSEGW